MKNNLMERSLLALAISGALFCVHPGPALAEEVLFQGQHRTLTFSFVHEGDVVSQRDWPEVESPRKFTMEVVLQQAGAELFLMVFDLHDRTADWWLSEVMGFLFDPGLEVTSGLTAQGYEVYEIRIPGGHGVYAQTEVLLVAPGEAYRFTCYRCAENGALESFGRLLDSFSSGSPLGPDWGPREATP